MTRSLALAAALSLAAACHAQPAPGAVDPLATLRSLAQMAADRSPLVREARANLSAADADLRQSRGGLYPRLEFSGTSRGEPVGSRSGVVTPARLEAAVTYNLYDFGRQRSQIRARESQAEAMRERVASARETAVHEAISAYLQLMRSEREVAVVEQHIRDLRSLVDKLRSIVAVFPGRRSELTQAETRVGQAGDNLATLSAHAREAQLALLRHTGQQLSSLAGAPLPVLPETAEAALLAQAREKHPALRAARFEAAALLRQADEARLAQRPEVDVQVIKPVGRDINGFTSPAQVALTAKWAAFDGFAADANANAFAERARAAEERGEQAFQELEFNLRAARAELETQTRRAADLERLAVGTDQVRRDTYDLWRELGRRSLLDVLTAENEHLNTRLSLVTAEVDRQLALLRMQHEAGVLADLLLDAPADAAVVRAAEADARRSGQEPAL